MKKIFTLLTFSMLFGSGLCAQVVINEYSASNLNVFLDQFQKTEDWIELYNTSDQTMDISGFHMSDKESKPGKWQIPVGTVIPGNGYLVIRCSGRDLVINGEYHANFKLSQTTGKDKVVFSDADENILDMHDMPITLTEHSNCRTENGSDTWVVSTSPTPGSSNNGSTQYARYTVAPTIELDAGFYNGEQTVTITNNEPNSVLRYTVNGNNPTPTSPEYNGPIVVSKTTVVKAQSFSNDPLVHVGKMDFSTYFIDEDFSLAVFSVAADQVINLANGNGALIPIGSLEYFNTDKEREAVAFGSLNRHGQDSWVLDHRSIDWVTRDEMGYNKAVDAELFSYSDRNEYQKFMFRNSGDDNYPAINDGAHDGSCHIRDEYVHTLAMEGGMKLDQRAVERVILFLNGEYWGLYGMRERPVDADYTDEYYGQDKYNTQFLSTWGSTEIQYGGQKAVDDWIELRNFILTNDMSVEENYKRADDEINLTSLIDYMIVNLTTVASDWLNYNTAWWRGLDPDGDHKKWGYLLWDLDATFDYYINYSGVPNISPDAAPCDLEDISVFMDQFFGNTPIDTTIIVGTDTIDCAASPYPGNDPILQELIGFDPSCCDVWSADCQNFYDFLSDFGIGGGDGDVGRHEKIFLKLLRESPEFKQLYYSRYADMMNTTFSCENMNTTLDRMLDVIRPEMPAQVARWGGSVTEWESNVQRMKDFINERCTLVNEGMIGCYDELSGPYQVTLLTEPDGIGEIDFNTLDIEEFPWSGDYFGGMDNKIKAKVFNDFEDEYKFSHWKNTSGNAVFADVNERRSTVSIAETDTIIAVFTINTATEDLIEEFEMKLYPNPANELLIFEYNLEEPADVRLSLSSILGQEIKVFAKNSGKQFAGDKKENLDISSLKIPSGLYLLNVNIDNKQKSFKVTILK